MKKKILAGLLSLAMVFSMMPVTPVSAEESDNATQTEIQTEKEQEPETEAAPEETQVQTSDSEAIEALQSRINALPTVDEFIALADGKTVEDSTLNQAQLDVYNETQAIAEEMDKFTDEAQGQLDTGKLEALFEYFNGMTEETATTISPVTSGSYYINSGGEYTLKGGTYSTSNSSIIINTTSPVTLNIAGNITATENAFIYVEAACSNLIINGNGKTINSAVQILNNINSSATVTLNNCVFKSSSSVTVANTGTIYVKSGSYSRTGSSGQVFSNADGTLYIQGGTITNVSGTNDAVAAGNVYMTGGTVSAPNGGGIRLSQSGTKAEITGGTISGSKYGVYLKSGNPTCKIGNVTFSGNTNDVYLASGHTFTLSTDYSGEDNIKVGIADTISGSTKRQITTAGTDSSMLAKVTSANSAYSVNYSKSGKYLYLWIHTHKLSYSSDGNTITAKCTADSDCQYYEDGLTLTLTAPDMAYTGSAYDKASVTNNITSVTGATAGTIKYYKTDAENTTTGGTSLSSAPTDAGYYYASVTIGGATATAAFKITSVQLQESDVTLDSSSFERTGSEISPAVTVKVTVNGTEIILKEGTDYEVSGDISKTDVGSYTLTVTGKGNYAGTFNKTWEITKQKATVEPEIQGWTYGETANTPGVTDSSNPENGEVTYTYYKDAECTIKTTSEDGAASDGAAPKNAGTYYVRAEVAETENYAAGSGRKEFTIAKKAVTAKVTAENKSYDGTTDAVVNAVVAGKDLVSGDKVTITGVTGTFADPNVGTDKDVTVNSTNQVIAGTGAGNYVVTVPSDTKADITAKKITKDMVSFTNDGNYTYTGSEISPVMTVKDGSMTLTASDYTVEGDQKGTEYGTYHMTVTGTGNYTGRVEVEWKITDPHAPTGSITIRTTNKWEQFVNAISFGLFFNNQDTVTIEADDIGSGVDTVSYYLTDKELTKDEAKSIADSKWNSYDKPFTIHPDGNYIVYVKITDKSGNVTYLSSDGFVVDSAAPELKDGEGKALKDNSAYCKAVTVAAIDANLDQVTVDGTKITDSDHHVITGDNEKHTIVAVDKSGNTTTCRVTVYKEHQYGEYQVVDKKDGVITEQRTCKNCGNTLKRISKESSSGKTDVTSEEDPSGGSLTSEVKVQPGTPETTVSGMDIDVAKKLLTDEENKKVSAGENLLVYLEVNKLEKDAVPEADKSKTEEKVKEIKEVKEGIYLDLSMYKKIGDADVTKLSKVETEKLLQISVEIPEELKAPAGKVRTYYVIRVHDGAATILETRKTGNEIQFETNQFSTYSLWYTEANQPSGGGSESSGSTTPAKPAFKITTSSSEGGRITASHKGDITKGDTVTYTITPADGYEIKDVLVDGKSVGAVTSYTFTNVTEKHTISAVFVKKNAQKPDDNKNNVTDQSKLNGNQVSKLKLPILLAKGKGGKQQITLSWLKVKDADGYEAYWSYCDGGKNYKKFATVKNGKLTVTQKKLKNSKQYKYFVVAYKMVDGKKVYIARSNYLHVAMLDNKQTNAKSVSVNKTDVVLTKKQIFTIQAKIRLENGKKKPLLHTAEFRYYTTDARVAKVNSDGVITAKGAGSCTVYVLANNGVYKKIKVTVK